MEGILILFLLSMSAVTTQVSLAFFFSQHTGIERALIGIATIACFTFTISPWLVPMWYEYWNYKDEYDALIRTWLSIIFFATLAGLSLVVKYGMPSLPIMASPRPASPILDPPTTPAADMTKSDDFIFSPGRSQLEPVHLPTPSPHITIEPPVETEAEFWAYLENQRAEADREEEVHWAYLEERREVRRQEAESMKALIVVEKAETNGHVAMSRPEQHEKAETNGLVARSRPEEPKKAVTNGQVAKSRPQPEKAVLIPDIPVQQSEIVVQRETPVWAGLTHEQRLVLMIITNSTLSSNSQRTIDRPVPATWSFEMACIRLAGHEDVKIPIASVLFRLAFLLQWVTHDTNSVWDASRLGDQWVINNSGIIERLLENATWIAQGWGHYPGYDYVLLVRNAIDIFRNAMYNMQRGQSSSLSAVHESAVPWTATQVSAQPAAPTFVPQAPFQQPLSGPYGGNGVASTQGTSSAQGQLPSSAPAGSETETSTGSTISAAYVPPPPPPAAPAPAQQPAVIPAGTKENLPTFNGLSSGDSRPVPTASSSAPALPALNSGAEYRKHVLNWPAVYDDRRTAFKKANISATQAGSQRLIKAWTETSVQEMAELVPNIDSMTTLKGTQLKYIWNRFEQIDKLVRDDSGETWDERWASKAWMVENGLFAAIDGLEKTLRRLGDSEHLRRIDEDMLRSSAWNAVDNMRNLGKR